MDPKRLFLASLLSLIVVLAWPLVFPSARPATVGDGDAAAATSEGAATTAGSTTPGASPGVPAEAAPASAPAGLAAAPTVAVEPIGAAAEVRPVLERGGLRVELSNRGGNVRSATVVEPSDATPVELVRTRAVGPYVFGLVDPQFVELAVERELFAVEEGAGAVTFRYRAGTADVTKRYRIGETGQLEVAIEARGVGAWSVAIGPGLRNLSDAELESRFSQRVGVYMTGGELETVQPAKETGPASVEPAGLAWVGLEDTYFLTLLVPTTPIAGARFVPVVLESGAPPRLLATETKLTRAEGKLPRELLVFVTPQGETFAATTYFGPKVYDRLVALGQGFEETVRWGMFGVLARPLLIGLQWIRANAVSNYGWAIVLMTVLIKIVLLPLTHKSYISMQKMQQLNPKVQAIRNAWRGKLRDKNGKFDMEAQQKMNAEVMALYSREGVNPTSGCLPLVLQLPILFAFYNLLSTAIELRGEPWVLWIHDLAAPDPYYVMPIVMGITQFIQTKMTPATGDPMQRRIFLFMPLIFTVLFLGFPAGLVLYWLTNNILTIAQTAGYNKLQQRRAAAV